MIRALKLANERGVVTIGLLGNDGGRAKDHVRLAIVVPSDDTARIQEVHITIGHIICEIVENELLGMKSKFKYFFRQQGTTQKFW